MKKIRKLYKPYMLRPILYKTITRLGIGLIAAILWDRYLNVKDFFSILNYAFFTVGVFFLALAWFNYLKLDGFKINHVNMNETKKKESKHKMKTMTDYVEEEPETMYVIDEKQKLLINFISNLTAGLCFTVISIISIVVYTA